MAGGFQVGPFQPAYQQEGAAPEPTPTQQGVSGGGGGVAKWPGRSEFGWEKWRRKEDAKLAKKRIQAEKKVEKLQQEVKQARLELSKSKDLEEIKILMAALERIQARLDKANQALDAIEMEEVMLVWTLVR